MATSTGNNTTPFYGCKISLISKSEIRYEGILYTIDPKESTIALAKVRSFGSEDRPVERPVPPRDDIFEFIIFRASDIKDLIVDDPPPAPQSALTDPAIIQASTQPAASTSFPAAFPASSSGAATTAAVQQPVQQQSSKAPGQGSKQQSGERHSQAEGSKGVSKQTSSSSVTSGQAFAKVAAGLSAAGSSSQPQQQPQQPQQPQQNKQTGQRQPNLSFSNKQQQQAKNDQSQPGAGGEQRNQRSNNQHQLTASGPRDGQGQNGFIRQNRQQNNQQNRVIGENANPNYHRNNGQQHQGFRSYNANRFVPRNQQGGSFVPGGFRRGNYNNGSGGIGNRPFIPRGPMTHPGVPKFPPLPDGDFDFEKSNADFKILEEKLCALKLNGALPSSSEGGDAPFELPEVPGIPASALTVAALEEEDISKEPCYNKTKSFFDSISCEALEREKGTNQRVDWKAERKQNRETFGIVAARRPTFYRNNRGGLGGGYHHHGGRGGYHQQRGHFQNRTGGPMNRVPRTPNTNGAPTANTVTSTTPTSRSSTGGGQPKTPNGVATSPAAPVAAKN